MLVPLDIKYDPVVGQKVCAPIPLPDVMNCWQDHSRCNSSDSLHRAMDGYLLLCAIKHETGESRAYRVDRIQNIEVSKMTLIPQYQIELTPTGPLAAPSIQRIAATRQVVSSIPKVAAERAKKSLIGHTYVFKCSSCGEPYRRKIYGATLPSYRNKNGLQCYGGFGSLVKTEY
jgi:hypothetical protein